MSVRQTDGGSFEEPEHEESLCASRICDLWLTTSAFRTTQGLQNQGFTIGRPRERGHGNWYQFSSTVCNYTFECEIALRPRSTHERHVAFHRLPNYNVPETVQETRPACPSRLRRREKERHCQLDCICIQNWQLPRVRPGVS